LSIWVQGEQIGRYFSVIRDQISGILRRMADLTYQEWIWLNPDLNQDMEQTLRGLDRKPEKANFLQLLKMEQAGQMTYISQSGASYNVADVLRIMPQKFRQTIASPSSKGSALNVDELTVFISYSHQGESYKNALATHLKGIKRRFESLDWWDDRKMIAGEWDPQILEKMDKADIVVLLISPDFVASDYCVKEMEAALNKY